MKTKKPIFIGAAILLVVLIALGSIYYFTRPDANVGSKTVTINIVVEGQETKTVTIHTDEEFLGPALRANRLVEGEESAYGFFVTAVDGLKADDTLQEWWCITKGGEDVFTGVDDTPIADGDVFELTLMVGY